MDVSHLRPLGEILLHRGQIRKFQLDFILDLQSAYKKIAKVYKLGDLLLKHRLVTQPALNEALMVQTELPHEGITSIIEKYHNEWSRQTKLLGSDHESQS